jgi:hypothetical protein
MVTGASGAHASAPHQVTGSAIRSALVIDCGSIFTKVALLDQVDGRHRLVAATSLPTTVSPPHADVMQGIRAAIGEIERANARVLLRDGRTLTPEQENGDGVDIVAITVSVGGPLHLLTTGAGRETLTSLVHRATSGLFIALDSLPAEAFAAGAGGGSAAVEQAASMQTARPQAVLVVGHPLESQRARPDTQETGRAIAAWLAAVQTLRAEGDAAPLVPVLFTGTPEDGAVLQNALPDRNAAHLLEALTPTTLVPLSRAVANLYANAVVRAIPGYSGLRALNSNFPSATTTSLAEAAHFLGQQYQMNVVAADVGASSTTLAGATASGTVLTALHPTAGVGPGAGAVLRAVGAGNVLRWLAEPVEEVELREYVLKRMLRPRLLPSTAREVEMEHALAREAIALALRAPGSTLAGLKPLDVIVGSGGTLAHAPQVAQAALVLLDALQPAGITTLTLDVAQLLGMLGSLSPAATALSMGVADGDAVVAQLGPVISTTGSVPDGQPAVTVTLEYADGRRESTEVAQGTIARLPLGPGEHATLSLFPAPTVDAGLGPGQHARASDPLQGGMLGLIIDARGRPLALPRQADERRARLRDWRRALGIES